MNRNQFKKLKNELSDLVPKYFDYRYDDEAYADHFIQSFFPNLSIEEIKQLSIKENISNDRDLLEYTAKQLWSK